MATAAGFGPMAMFPLQSALLPDEDLPLQIFEPRYAALVRDCIRDKDPRFGVVLISQGREVGGGEVRCDVGTVARITECVGHRRLRQVRAALPDGRTDQGVRVVA